MLKFKNLSTIALLAPLTILLAGCPTFSLVSPSFTYNNNYNNAKNPNNISCDPGTWYSSAYCSIPIPKFIAITSQYANPYPENLLFSYAITNNSFLFEDVMNVTTLVKLNEIFLQNYPKSENIAYFSPGLQKLYQKLKDEYIPENNYQKQFETYVYIYTLSALDFATHPCTVLERPLSFTANDPTQRQFMLYKAFAMQYANDIFHHISSSIDGKYDDEADVYNHLYDKILKLDPYQLDTLARKLYSNTLNFTPVFESDFYSSTGANFNKLGTFSCSSETTSWQRFGFEFFGVNVSGLNHVVNFKNKDDYKQVNDKIIPVNLESATHLK